MGNGEHAFCASPWTKITPDNDAILEPDSADSYTGRSGGGFLEPVHLFVILPWSFFVLVAERTEEYAYKDLVVEKHGKDQDSNTRKKYPLEKVRGGNTWLLSLS